jgi:hypothetical protein
MTQCYLFIKVVRMNKCSIVADPLPELLQRLLLKFRSLNYVKYHYVFIFAAETRGHK